MEKVIRYLVHSEKSCKLSLYSVNTDIASDLPELLTCGRGPGLQALLGH